MKRYVGIMIAVVLPMIGFSESPLRIDGVSAYANEHVITVSDVLKSSRALQELLASKRDGEELNKVYRDAIDEVISRKLIVDEYESQKEIRIPEGVVEERVDSIVREMFNGERSELLKALAKDGLSEEIWRAQIQEQTIVSAMRNLRVDSKLSISPLTVREAYDRDRAKYATPPKVKLRMIVIAKGDTPEETTAQRAKLERVKAALAKGDAFATVAVAHSEDSRAAEGGDRGWLERDMLREDLAKVAFACAVGAVSETVDIGKQVCILTVEDKVDAVLIPFEDVQGRIERELQIGQSRQLFDAWIARLRKHAYVKIVDKALAP